MLARRFISLFKRSPTLQVSSSAKPVDEVKRKPYGRKAVSFVLITVTGGVALSALDDLVIYQSCSSKALEKASKNHAVIDAIGEPIKKGPWYSASLAVAHKRHSVSCTFPVSGPQGTGIFQLKAVRNGDESWFPFLQQRDWDILIMDALLHVPTTTRSIKHCGLVSLTSLLQLVRHAPPPTASLKNQRIQRGNEGHILVSMLRCFLI